MTEQSGDRQLVAVMLKTMPLLEILVGAVEPVGVTELARKTSMPKSTVFRILTTLVHLDLVARHGRRYTVGPRFESLSYPLATRYRALSDSLLPYMVELYNDVHQKVTLSVLAGDQLFVVNKIHGHDRAHRCCPGVTVPAYCTASGKVLLAYSASRVQVSETALVARTRATLTDLNELHIQLDRVRKEGIAYSRGEFSPGMVSIAVPILDSGGTLVAALGLCGPSGGWHNHRTVETLRRAAHAMSRRRPIGN
ncbi:IclR family transcriptional regulator [Nocardia vinacea]|uniref:IclR family transcriptional regulator n=1 Tax=Nocardia vinacea TaxID=96468 RepID=A0ABZ1YTL8_9NOCA|nr:IclR family transcriptional regulator [Nocardia vinacea]